MTGTDRTLKHMLTAIEHYVAGRYVSAQSSISSAEDKINRLAYEYRRSEPEKRGLCPRCGFELYTFHKDMGQCCSNCNYMVPDENQGDVIYLGLYGTYPIDTDDEDQLMARKASEGTKKISDLIDKFVLDLLCLQEEYSNEGATDTSARENIFGTLDDRYYEKRMEGF